MHNIFFGQGFRKYYDKINKIQWMPYLWELDKRKEIFENKKSSFKAASKGERPVSNRRPPEPQSGALTN